MDFTHFNTLIFQEFEMLFLTTNTCKYLYFDLTDNFPILDV